MTDKSWMLNPKAIRHAKECIQLVREREGVKLRLSQEDFLPQLHQQVDASGCPELGEAYARLISMAGVGFVIQQLQPKNNQQESLGRGDVQTFRAVGDEDIASFHSAETVEYGGRVYPKFRSGLQFRGVYRGQPTYS
ncbi:MAG: hypothetical protein K6L76_13320 [Agarilytica sp.]